MNRMYPINYNIPTSVWERGQYKYSIILNTKKINLKDKLIGCIIFSGCKQNIHYF